MFPSCKGMALIRYEGWEDKLYFSLIFKVGLEMPDLM